MIKVIGIRRIGFLLGIFALNVVLAMAAYSYLQPEIVQGERQLKSVKNKVKSVRRDIDNMLVEFEKLAEQQEFFDVLEADKFFSEQSRRQAEDTLLYIRDKSGVASVSVTVEPGAVRENEEAAKANYDLLVSPIRLTIGAIQDRDIYVYLYLMEQIFPGHISIGKFTMRRKANISLGILKSIATGNNPSLLEAQVEMTWTTMVPKKDKNEN